MIVKKAIEYFEKNFHKNLEDLKKLVRIPSISLKECDPTHVKLCAEATAELFHQSGLENVELLEIGQDISDEQRSPISISDGYIHPYVYGEWIHKPNAPTFLLYAHHDVQPIGREEKWLTPPFEPTEKNGRLYGRGTADDKAGIIVHTASIASFLKTCGELPINVKVLIEGEEEIGSQNLGSFVNLYKNKLKANGMILTDCANIDSGVPSITTSLRGLVSLDIEVQTLEHPVHSGLWGGILPDPILALSRILSSLCDMQGNILVPGIMDDVIPLNKEEEESFANLNMEFIARQATGLLNELPFTVPKTQFGTRLWRFPYLNISAIQSGSRKQVSNIVQDSAWARVSIRTVPNMKPQDIENKLKKHILSVCPDGVKVQLTTESASNWWKLSNQNDKIFQIASLALEKGYGKPTQFIGCGATIPFVQPLSHELGGIPAILVGVEDPYTNAHAENESLLLSDFKKSILGQIHMFFDFSGVNYNH